MIRKPQNWENVQVMTDKVKLPVGAYVCRVKQVAVQNNGYGDQFGIEYLDIENAMVFLASDYSSYMTGQAINVTGGQQM